MIPEMPHNRSSFQPIRWGLGCNFRGGVLLGRSVWRSHGPRMAFAEESADGFKVLRAQKYVGELLENTDIKTLLWRFSIEEKSNRAARQAGQ